MPLPPISNCHPRLERGSRAKCSAGGFGQRLSRGVEVTILWCFVLLSITSHTHAGQYKIFVGNGTGFVVSGQGHIVTNQHVVEYCEELNVRGAGGAPYPAQVIARDMKNDLALLKINAVFNRFAQFRSFKEPLKPDDRVVVVGFPKESRDAVTHEARIISPKGPRGEAQWLLLSDVLEQGNSGGPLFDSAGNIVGVTTAKAVTYSYNTATPQDVTKSEYSVALAAPVVQDFLRRYKVRFETADNGIYLPAGEITQNARAYTLHVRCEYKTELR